MNYHILLFTALLIQAMSKKKYLTCHDLALLGPCCGECHDQAAAHGNERALIHDDDGHGRPALLCCHASLIIHGFNGIPDHAMECA